MNDAVESNSVPPSAAVIGTEIDATEQWFDELKAVVAGVPGVADVVGDPQAQLDRDGSERTAAISVKVSVSDAESTTVVAQRVAASIRDWADSSGLAASSIQVEVAAIIPKV